MAEKTDVFSANEPFVFECDPAIAKVNGEIICAWRKWRIGGNDVIAARWPESGGMQILSSEESTAGSPQLAAGRSGAWVVWESCSQGKWSVSGRIMGKSGIGSEKRIAEDSFAPAVSSDSNGDVWCVYIEASDGKRSLKLINLDDAGSAPIVIPTMGAKCYRPKITSANGDLWVNWDAYIDSRYRVCVCQVKGSVPQKPEVLSDGPHDDIISTACADSRGRLWVAWINSQDVEDANGAVDQYQSLQAARWDSGRWERLPETATLHQGLVLAIWGYLGRRRRPMFVVDGERVWLVWERKDKDSNSTRVTRGALCGKYFGDGKWSEEFELCNGFLSYEAAWEAKQGKMAFAARDADAGVEWNSGVINVYEAAWGALVAGEIELNQDLAEFHAEKADGWKPVELAEKRPETPRKPVQATDGKLSLFWGDTHFHSAQTRDAEGELDELIHYARDKARLDFCAICDNDVYCLPLTEHDWARQQRAIESHSDPGRFVVVPSYEWTLQDAEIKKPNHRLVFYTRTGETLWRQINPGGQNIHELAESVECASGLLIGHHLGWVFAESKAEAAIEIVSAWSPHMVLNPKFVHNTLNTGRRLGFTGGSDSHRRNPGLCGALTGVYASELTVEAIVEAIRRRRTVATTGSMIGLEFRIGEAFIGDDVSLAGRVPVTVRARSQRLIKSLAVIRDGEVIKELDDINEGEAVLEFPEDVLPGTHWYYARAVLCGETPKKLPATFATAEGNHAWTSPIWVSSQR